MKNNHIIVPLVLVLMVILNSNVLSKTIKVLCLIPSKHCETYYYNRDNMESYGWEITTTGVTQSVSPDPAYAGALGCPKITVDFLITDITNIKEYDCLVVMMGAPWSGSPCQDIINSPAALNLIKAAVDSGLVVAGMASGVRVLAAADVIRGKNITGWPDYAEEYRAAGARFFGKFRMPMIDGQIVTSSDAGDYYHPENCEAIATALERLRKEQEPEYIAPATITNTIDLDGTLWTKTYGGIDADGGRCVRTTSDDGLIITGYTYSYGEGNADNYLIKTDAEGNVQWSNTYGGNGRDFGNEVVESPDGGFLIIGYTYSYGAGDADIWLVKTDALGNKMWDKTFGSTGLDIGKSIQITDDNSILLLGNTESFGVKEDDIYLIKTDSVGNVLWEKTYFGDVRSDLGAAIKITSDGNYAIFGATGYFNNTGVGDCNRDMFLIKTDADGAILWNKKYDFVNSGHTNQQFGNQLLEIPNRKFILTGHTDVFYADLLQIYVVKADSNGTKISSRYFGMSSNYDYCNSSILSDDGKIVICGTTKSFSGTKNNFYVAQLDTSGKLEWQKSFGGNGYEWGTSIAQTSDGNYVVLGQSNSFGAGSYDVCLMKIKGTTTGVQNIKNIEEEKNYSNCPNPFNAGTMIQYFLPRSTSVKLVIYNSLGQKIRTLVNEYQNAGYRKIQWNGTDDKGNSISSGIYFYTLQFDGKRTTKKMSLIK